MEPHNNPFQLPLTEPFFIEEATTLNTVLLHLTPKKLAALMHISPKLAEMTHQRISVWSTKNGTPAWYTFVGDVYKGLKINEFTQEDLEFAQLHMGTISGLYGLVRPLDAIQQYRLELMYGLKGKGFNNLYEFWGDKIAKTIPENEPVINLSSEEYIKVLRPFLPKEQIITPWFMQLKNGEPDFQVVHAKVARGAMARWIAKHRANDPAQLTGFNYGGYTYQAELSTPLKPTFTRPEGYDFRADY